VQAVAATDSLPLTQFNRITPAEIEGRPPIDLRKAKPGEVRPVSRPTVTLDYFNAMGIPLRSGRAFTLPDARSPSESVIVNEAFEKHYFPGQSAVGKRIRRMVRGAEARWQTVVGVVSDVRQSGLAGDIMPEVYSPELEDVGGELSFVIRATGEPASLISAVRRVVAEVEPNQAPHNVMTMEQRLANTTTSRRLNTVLLGSFAGLALLLAVVGIYGVMSYAVTQRTREIGVRIALGASSKEIIKLIVGQGALLVGIGVVIGLGVAALGTRLLANLLFGVSALDPVTFVGVTALLAATAFLACYLPAGRATKVDPMVALRQE